MSFRLLRFLFVSNKITHTVLQMQEAPLSTAALVNVSLPVEREVQAALEGQRAFSAFLAARVEPQQLRIFDDKTQAHRVELPTSARRLLVGILAELAEGHAVKVVP